MTPLNVHLLKILLEAKKGMTKATTAQVESKLRGEFHEEYSGAAAIRRYSKGTAGYGISYLLEHDYGKIYLESIEKYLPKDRAQAGLRIWEFGCGAGMNLLHLVMLLESRGIRVERAIGTDFSEVLINTANEETRRYLPAEHAGKTRFCVGRNEALIEDGMRELRVGRTELVGKFDLLLGVNTIRYCHRLHNENRAVAEIYELLAPGGVCINIDMNDKFPAFRSRLRDTLTKDPEALYFPSLEEYARPFSEAGLEVVRKQRFCWIPHSAGRGLTSVMRAIGPVLGAVMPDRAMRSLVVSLKNQ